MSIIDFSKYVPLAVAAARYGISEGGLLGWKQRNKRAWPQAAILRHPETGKRVCRIDLLDRFVWEGHVRPRRLPVDTARETRNRNRFSATDNGR